MEILWKSMATVNCGCQLSSNIYYFALSRRKKLIKVWNKWMVSKRWQNCSLVCLCYNCNPIGWKLYSLHLFYSKVCSHFSSFSYNLIPNKLHAFYLYTNCCHVSKFCCGHKYGTDIIIHRLKMVMGKLFVLASVTANACQVFLFSRAYQEDIAWKYVF